MVNNILNGKSRTCYSTKSTFDNTANHEIPKGVSSMNTEELAKFKDSLAKKSDGSLWSF